MDFFNRHAMGKDLLRLKPLQLTVTVDRTMLHVQTNKQYPLRRMLKVDVEDVGRGKKGASGRP